MIEDATRLAGTVVSWPAGAFARVVQGLASGSDVLLDLEVQRWDDTMLRQAILHRLRRAAADPSVSGLLVRLEAPPASWAATQDLREALLRFRKAGKPVYAWLEAPSHALVWLASAADRVFLLPTGDVALTGVGAELTFFGGMLERLGIEPDFEAAGAYKSFGEPYTRTFASPANQEAMRALVNDLQEQLVSGIAEGRGLTVDAVRELFEKAPLSAQAALDAKLVDQLAYLDEVFAWSDEKHGKRAQRVDFKAWARRDAVIEWTDRWGDVPTAIAVVHMDGPIVVDDKGPGVLVRARHVVTLLRKLREDDEVKAVVLHVNSPGGSAIASDLIWREVDLLQRKKPVVASFEDVSASGGFYLAAPAAEILARPATLTGSIGVFGGKLVIGEGLRKLGVHQQEIAAAPNALLYSSSKPFDEAQRIRFKASLQRFYDGFVQRVAAGRKRPVEDVEPHCRGRVWTGKAALDLGLVDRHGDLVDAIERARVLSGVAVGEYRQRHISAQPNRSVLARALHAVVRSFVPGHARAEAILRTAEAWLGGPLSPVLQTVLSHPEQPLAMMPFDLELK
jgi:protease-4